MECNTVVDTMHRIHTDEILLQKYLIQKIKHVDDRDLLPPTSSHVLSPFKY